MSKLSKRIIGITGNIGSGKSTVCNIIRSLNKEVIDCDVLANEVYDRDCHEYRNIIELFKNYDIITNNKIDKAKIRKLVFDNLNLKKDLENIIFPYVLKRIQELCKNKINYVEIPLLFEAGFDVICDKIILVYADEELIYDRVSRRSNLNKEEINKILASQHLIKDKIEKSDYLIANNHDLKYLYDQVLTVVEQIEER